MLCTLLFLDTVLWSFYFCKAFSLSLAFIDSCITDSLSSEDTFLKVLLDVCTSISGNIADNLTATVNFEYIDKDSGKFEREYLVYCEEDFDDVSFCELHYTSLSLVRMRKYEYVHVLIIFIKSVFMLLILIFKRNVKMFDHLNLQHVTSSYFLLG